MLVYLIVNLNCDIYIKLGLEEGVSVIGILMIMLSEVLIIVSDIVIKLGDV